MMVSRKINGTEISFKEMGIRYAQLPRQVGGNGIQGRTMFNTCKKSMGMKMSSN